MKTSKDWLTGTFVKKGWLIATCVGGLVFAIVIGFQIFHKKTSSLPPGASVVPPPSPPDQKAGVSSNPAYRRRIDILNRERTAEKAGQNVIPSSPFEAPPVARLALPRREKISTQRIFCRFGRLTDIVVFGKALRVISSDPANFKIETIPDGIVRRLLYSHTMHIIHLVVKPLKESATTDLFIFDGSRAYYLSLKTVSKGHRYATRVVIGAPEDADEERSVSDPYPSLPAERN